MSSPVAASNSLVGAYDGRIALPPAKRAKTNIKSTVGPCLLPIYLELPDVPNCSSWKPRQLTHEKAITKMYTNMEKALTEHFGKDPAYASVKKALPSEKTLLEQTQANIKETLSFNFTSDARQGERNWMEDRHYYLLSDEFVLAAIFDGHGGDQASQIALENLKSTLITHRDLQLAQDEVLNVHAMLESIIDDLNQKILKGVKKENPKDPDIGTTAVILYIDRKTNLVYTATVGDSEANLYRDKSIPLSCVRDWATSDFERFAIAHNDPGIAQRIHNHIMKEAFKKKHLYINEPFKYNSKQLRSHFDENAIFPQRPYSGLNVSRALGDRDSNILNGNALVIPKPKITVFGPIQPGDVITLASDGLKDFCLEEEIVQVLNKCVTGNNLSRALVEYALTKKHPFQDNISVVSIHVGKHDPNADEKSVSESKEEDLDASNSTCDTEDYNRDEEDLPCEEDEESDGCYYTKSKSDPCA